MPRSETMKRRPPPVAACKATAALSTLNRFTDVESPTLTSSGAAPISGAMAAPVRAARSIQPASFQLRMRPSPHSFVASAASRAGVRRGNAPSELPSR